MQVNSASNRKIFVFLFCVFVNYYNAFWITVRTLITFDGQIPKGTVNFHDGFKADGRQVSLGAGPYSDVVEMLNNIETSEFAIVGCE